ncbi:hypothetical protein EVAR_43686_1 [Eumeta japonica]|uniref:Uncharacterized protein n=1 Tax=Eumeta variegata TaxID=151549 RepID=A0A4C1X0R6_EUMVA|nr:hypothetical protein EVAR_43686_1 [Eumeta japonica]
MELRARSLRGPVVMGTRQVDAVTYGYCSLTPRPRRPFMRPIPPRRELKIKGSRLKVLKRNENEETGQVRRLRPPGARQTRRRTMGKSGFAAQAGAPGPGPARPSLAATGPPRAPPLGGSLPPAPRHYANK